VVCSGGIVGVVGEVGRCAHADFPRRRTLAPQASSSESASAPCGNLHGPNRVRRITVGHELGGRWVDATNRASWQVATLRRRRRSRPRPLALRHSLARWQKPWQRRQYCGNRQVVTRCELERQLKHLSRSSAGTCRSCFGDAKPRRPQVASPVVGESPATHRCWGWRLIHGAQGVGGQGYDHPQAEQASCAPAGGAASYISSAFAQVLAAQRPSRLYLE
jgi:hypothetical protein